MSGPIGGARSDGEGLEPTFSTNNALHVNTVAEAAVQSDLETGNSTIVVTDAFTGTAEQNNYSDVGVSCFSDVEGMLYFDFSVNGTDWRTFPSSGYSVGASIHEFHTAVKLGRYFRIRWASDTTPTVLQIYTYYGTFRQPSAPLNQSLGLDSDAIATRPSSFADEVSAGRRPGVTSWTKFGYRTSTTASAGEETIWADTGNLTIMTSAETFDIAFNDSTDGLGTTGALVLLVDYLDENFELQQAQHTLTGTSPDTTSFSGLGINRIVVVSSGSANHNVNDFTITATTAGTTQATIPAEGSVTQQLIFHFPINTHAAAKYLRLHANKPGGGGSPKVAFKGYVYNRLVETTYEIFRETIDTGSGEALIEVVDPVNFSIGGRDVLYFTMDTSSNNTEVTGRFSFILYDDI